MNLPNAITMLRVVLAPVVGWLLFQPSAFVRVLAFIVFLAAAVSDLADGRLARSRGEITNLGKLIDPIADKLLLFVCLVSFFILVGRSSNLGGIPLFDGFPLWVLIVFFAREILVTGLRILAAGRGVIVAAGTSGKRKALAQNVFIGSMILWIAYRTAAAERELPGELYRGWGEFHGWFASTALIVALLLTVYSLGVYVLTFRRILAR